MELVNILWVRGGHFAPSLLPLRAVLLACTPAGEAKARQVILWALFLIFIAWPVSFFLGGFWLFFIPFQVVLEHFGCGCLKPVVDFLKKALEWPEVIAKKMVGGDSVRPPPPPQPVAVSSLDVIPHKHNSSRGTHNCQPAHKLPARDLHPQSALSSYPSA